MKYMGSKRALLRNGLGSLLLSDASGASRFVDLFAGTGVVSAHVARQCAIPVLAVDLQQYSAALSGAVLLRTRPVDPTRLRIDWLDRAARATRRSHKARRGAEDWTVASARHIEAARIVCSEPSHVGPIWNAYGGHYYSPLQALTFDYMLKFLPTEPASRALCMAATLQAASRCAASPGHTAQPFQPTANALPSIRDAWTRDPIQIAAEALGDVAKLFALRKGRTLVANANTVAAKLRPTDLVFLDPPYSAAQYSRFYHVLETMAVGRCGVVSGAGRYPPIEERPLSDYSLKSGALSAVRDLLERIASSGSRAIMTFPQHPSSNGLSGEEILRIARSRFSVDVHQVASRFSTMGGNGALRASRHRSSELILAMSPKRSVALAFAPARRSSHADAATRRARG